MLNKKKMIFKTFFLGKEKASNPSVKEMIGIGRALVDVSSNPDVLGNISTRYGKRVLITSCNVRIGYLIEDDFVEVADYDANRNIAFVIGKNELSFEMPMHWLLYRGEDIKAIFHIRKVLNGLPTTELERLPGSLGLVLEALRPLQNRNCIILKNHGCVAIGKNLRNTMEAILCA